MYSVEENRKCARAPRLGVEKSCVAVSGVRVGVRTRAVLKLAERRALQTPVQSSLVVTEHAHERP
jgi:hypothetical protein